MNKTKIEEDIKILRHHENMIATCDKDNRIFKAIENILADRERLEKEKEIHIKLEQQYKKEYLDIKDKYDSLIKEIEDKINKRKIKYNEILNDYGNIDTDVIFNIPNKNVRKRLDELSFEITTLQELLDKKEEI